MNKHLIIICLTLLSFVPALSGTDFESATEAVKNMRVGWNLANSLECHKVGVTDVTATELMRGQPVTQPELMEMMKMAGFNAIRVPVTWYPHLDGDNIDDAWLNRVQEVVDYVIDQNMYCIVNVHHDTGQTDNTGVTLKGWLKADVDNYNQNKARFESIWRQIAERFKDYGPLLIFEGYNEMLDTYNSFIYATSASPEYYDAEVAESAYKAVNNYAASFVQAVRATGGNNAVRNLLVNTYATGEGRGTYSVHITDPLEFMEKPEQSDHIIFGVHSYPPIIDTVDGVAQNRSMETIKAQIDGMMDNLATYFIKRYDAPVIIGEWGTSEVDSPLTDYDLRRDHMFDFVDYFVKAAKQRNIATLYWAGLSHAANRRIPVFNQADLAERILKAYYGEDYIPTVLTTDDYDYTKLDVTFTKQYAELTLAQDATDLMNEYSGIEIILDEKPALSQKELNIRVVNDTKNVDVQKITTSTSNVLNFSTANLSPIKKVVLKWRSVGETTIRIQHVYLIRKDGTKQEVMPANANSCVLLPEPAYLKSWVNEPHYGTLYCGTSNLLVPPRVTARAYKVSADSLLAVATYEAGDVIPAATGVVISADEPGLFKFSMTDREGIAATGSMLKGTDTETLTTGGNRYYRLTVKQEDGTDLTGLYYDDENGKSFTNKAHEAYLAFKTADLPYWSPQYLFNDISLEINEANFPDENFRTFLTEKLNYTAAKTTVYPGADGKLNYNEQARITALNCQGQSIASLQGIGLFSGLKTLDCSNNNLVSLDLSANTALTSVDYSGQMRAVAAQSAFADYTDEQGRQRLGKYYYLRLDDKVTEAGEQNLWQSLGTDDFDLDRVSWLDGGTLITGSRRTSGPGVGDIKTDEVYGTVLVLTDVNVNDGVASGQLTYAYDVNLPASAAVSDPQSAFTLNWSANAAPGVVTGIEDISAGSQPVEVAYYDLTGHRSECPLPGVSIMVARYADGTVTVTKSVN